MSVAAVKPPAPPRAEPELEDGASSGGLRLVALRVVQYLTNYVISHVPSFAVRRLWYERVVGIEFGEHAGIHLGAFIWCYSLRQVRRTGCRIGAHSRINRSCCLDARGPLRIGENVSVSPEVMILTAAHGVDDPGFRVEVRPVVIEDRVWIGARAVILPGVTLGHGCVVAAGAVVTRDVAPLTFVAGVPARPVRMRAAKAERYVLDVPFPLFE